jgi:hypothetical protein
MTTGASPISPQDVSLLEPVRRCFDCVLDAVEIGAVPRGHVETPLVAYGINFHMGDVFAPGNASKLSKGNQLQILCRDHRGDHRRTPYNNADNSDLESVFLNDAKAAATVVVRRGVTEAQARRIYLDYRNRAQPHRRGARTAA